MPPRSLALHTAILGLAFILLTHNLARPSLWVDELFSVQIAEAPTVAQVIEGVLNQERRPPLYHLALHGWMALAGNAEFNLRLLSVMAGLVVVAGTARLARRVAGQSTGLVAGFLTALSPAFVLYSRMVRYYSLLALLTLASTLLFLQVLDRLHRGARLGKLPYAYLAVTLALIYADYASIAIAVVHTAYLLVALRRLAGQPIHGQLRLTSYVLAGWALLLALWLPWVITDWRTNAGPGGIPADLSASVIGVALKAAYPFWAFVVGETLFPWNPAAVLAGAIGFFALTRALKAVWAAHATRPRALQNQRGLSLVAILAVVPVVATIALTFAAATDLPFVAVPSRSIAALPFVLVLMAVGLGGMPARPPIAPAVWRVLAFGGLCAAYLAALGNLYAGREYLNPIYNLPAREIAAQIVARARPGDVIVADWDSAVPYYLGRLSNDLPLIETPPPEAALAQLLGLNPPPDRVWVIELGRDRTRALTVQSGALTAWLEAKYPVSFEWGYGEQDALYRQVKMELLRQPAYRYRATVRLYSTP